MSTDYAIRDSSAAGYLELVDPRGALASAVEHTQVVRDAGQQVKTFGIVTHGSWRSWDLFRERLEHHLANGEGGLQSVRYQDEHPHPAERYDEIARSVDVAVLGLGNCGSCTNKVATATAELAARGLPVIVAVTAGFHTLAVKTLEFRKQGHVPVFVLPAAYEVMTDDEIYGIADERVAELEATLLELASQ